MALWVFKNAPVQTAHILTFSKNIGLAGLYSSCGDVAWLPRSMVQVRWRDRGKHGSILPAFVFLCPFSLDCVSLLAFLASSVRFNLQASPRGFYQHVSCAAFTVSCRMFSCVREGFVTGRCFAEPEIHCWVSIIRQIDLGISISRPFIFLFHSVWVRTLSEI